MTYDEALQKLDAVLIARALIASDMKKSVAAAAIGLTRRQIKRRMFRYKLTTYNDVHKTAEVSPLLILKEYDNALRSVGHGDGSDTPQLRPDTATGMC